MSTNCDHPGCVQYIRCRVKPRDLPKSLTVEDLGHLKAWIRTGHLGLDDPRRVNILIEAYNNLMDRVEKAQEVLGQATPEDNVDHIMLCISRARGHLG